MSIKNSMYRHLKPDAASAYWKSLEKRASLESKSVKKQEMSNEDVAKWILGALNG